MALIQLVKRNTLLYLRDKATVFFSMISVVIIIFMYILFLGKMQSDNLGDYFKNTKGVDWLVSSWIMAGILIVSTVTVPLGALGTLIRDRENGKIADFYTSPIDRNILAISYLLSSWIIAIFMVSLNFILGQIYVVISGGQLLSFYNSLIVFGTMTISIICFSSFFFYIALFMKTQNAFGLLSTLTSTFIGFLGGIYIPIGVLGVNVQNIMNIFPTAHSVTLMRRVYMKEAIKSVFNNAPQEAYESYAKIYGLNVNIGGFEFNNLQMLLYIVLFGIIFYILSIIKLSKSKL